MTWKWKHVGGNVVDVLIHVVRDVGKLMRS